MPPVRFSKEDFLAGKVVKPGYYHILVKPIEMKGAKTDGSQVYKLNHKIVEPGEYYGVPLQDYMSEKAMGMAIPFIKACLGGKEPEPDVNYELANGVGMVIKAQVSNTLYNGRVKNEITDYQPADANFKIQDE